MCLYYDPEALEENYEAGDKRRAKIKRETLSDGVRMANVSQLEPRL